MTGITAYPLVWPPGWPRTAVPEAARFSIGFEDARRELERELSLLGARSVTVSTNIPLRQTDGKPYARYGPILDTGVAVYFWLHGEEHCIPCDRWKEVKDNIRAIGKTVEALRGIERWGAGTMQRAVFTGFRALPEAASSTGWWSALGVARDAPWDVVIDAYKAKLKDHHPDRGGSHEAFVATQDAFEAARRERGR